MASIEVRVFRQADPAGLHAEFSAVGWEKPVSLFERYVEEHVAGARYCALAEFNGQISGYVTLAWTSSYPPFAAEEIPEISDLNVLPQYRRQGIAARLLDHVEAVARGRSATVGLGVGLYSDYGAAQRIYVRRGFVPDGRGLMYSNEPVIPGDVVRVDDDATLMFTKRLDPHA